MFASAKTNSERRWRFDRWIVGAQQPILFLFTERSYQTVKNGVIHRFWSMKKTLKVFIIPSHHRRLTSVSRKSMTRPLRTHSSLFPQCKALQELWESKLNSLYSKNMVLFFFHTFYSADGSAVIFITFFAHRTDCKSGVRTRMRCGRLTTPKCCTTLWTRLVRESHSSMSRTATSPSPPSRPMPFWWEVMMPK